MRAVMYELRHAWRGLLRRPGFTLAAVLTLGVGIGATTSMFATVYGLLVAPLPFEGGDRLGFAWWAAEGGMMVTPSPEVIDAWREGARTVERLGSFTGGEVTIEEAGAPATLNAGRLEPALLSMLGVAPVLGRGFVEEEALPGGPRVVLLAEGFWTSRYGRDRGLIGAKLTLDGVPHTVIGVVPGRLAALDVGSDRQIWLPLVRDTSVEHANVLVRVRPGLARADVEAELTAIARRVPDSTPAQGEWRIRVVTPADFLGAETRRAFLILLGAVGVVLLIACANVAGLQLARGEGRRRELAIRAALGAGRGRVLRHAAVESVLVAALGGLLGALLATWMLDLVRLLRPETLEALDVVRLDARAFAFAGVLSLVSALICGVAPGLALARSDLMAPLKRSGGGAPASARARGVLVTAQIALSVVLLVGAALLIRSLAELQRRDVGFLPEGLLTATVRLPEERYATPEARSAFYLQLRERVVTLPAVTSATLSSGVPPGLGIMFGRLRIQGREIDDGATIRPAAMVDHDYHTTLGLRLIEGRWLAEGEEDVVVINRSMARRYWREDSPLGERIRLGDRGEWDVVVGVVEDVAAGGFAGDMTRDVLFFPPSYEWDFQTVTVRTTGDPATLAPAVRQELARLDPALPLREVATVAERMRGSIARQRFNMALLTAFAVVALALAGIGLYGLISYTVAQRTREIGIRMALGAEPGAVRRMVVGQGLRLVLLGLAIGGCAAVAFARLLRSQLHGLGPYDPLAFAFAIAAIVAGSVLASYLPAARASAVDPLAALRAE